MGKGSAIAGFVLSIVGTVFGFLNGAFRLLAFPSQSSVLFYP